MTWLILLVIFPGFILHVQAKDVNYRCDEGWVNFGDRCYRILGNVPMHKEPYAVDLCATAKAHLFVPSSQEEYDAVTSYINNLGYVSAPNNPIEAPIYDVWIGCDDVDVEGTFMCTDGITFDSTSGWWAVSEGDNWGEADCVTYRTPSDFGQLEGLADDDCTTFESKVLCEAPAAKTLSSSYRASPLPNRCLRGYTQKTVQKKSKTRCAAECLKEDYCVSFNFKDGVCDLNYSTRDQADYSAFQEEDGCSYFEP